MQCFAHKNKLRDNPSYTVQFFVNLSRNSIARQVAGEISQCNRALKLFFYWFSETVPQLCTVPFLKMYGMLLESVHHFVKEKYGENVWRQVSQLVGSPQVFVTHQMYSDELLPHFSEAMAEVVGETDGMTADDYMHYFGVCFVKFFSHYGYDRIVQVSGRYLRDFLIGIDDLHEHMRFGYPNLRSPMFYCDEETSCGLVLHYQSFRKGFKHYVMGQVEEIARSFYKTDSLKITIIREDITDFETRVAYALKFDNTGYKPVAPEHLFTGTKRYLSSDTFFNIVPFSCVISGDLTISMAGYGLISTLGNRIIGCKASDIFTIRRPKVDFTWQNVSNDFSYYIHVEGSDISIYTQISLKHLLINSLKKFHRLPNYFKIYF